MSTLTDPDFSGRHLREVLRQRPDLCEAEHYQQGLEVVHDAGVQLAFEGEHPDVPAALVAHARRMRQRIYRAGERVYCAVGYALANVIIVRCEQALVVLDTTESHTSAMQILQDFRSAVPEVADWPVAALVYTHNHSDHINGARAFVSEDDLQAGRLAQQRPDLRRDQQPHAELLGRRLDAAGDVHRVAPEVVGEFTCADNTRHCLARMNADAKLDKLTFLCSERHFFHYSLYFQCKTGDTLNVVITTFWQPTGYHISITDGFDFF